MGRRRSFGREEAAELWEQPGMRQALLQRDVSMIFRGLMKRGISQRAIAAYTGQSQSEISEVLHGRRIGSYDVLERICVGLMIPPGHMGMAYDRETIWLLGPRHPQWQGALLVRPQPPTPPKLEEPRPVRPSYETRLGEEGGLPFRDLVALLAAERPNKPA